MADEPKTAGEVYSLIRAALGKPDLSDAQCVAFALETVGRMLATDLVPMTRADIESFTLAYAAYALSVHTGRPHVAVDMGDGTIGFAETDGETDGAPANMPPVSGAVH